MSTRLLVIASALLGLAGCEAYVRGTPRVFLETDHEANYRRIFRSEVPEGVTVVNSVVVDYAWRPGVVTTDDWEIELLVPRSCVLAKQEDLRLRGPPTGWVLDFIQDRKSHPIRPWYAPAPIAEYEVYSLYATSIPYVHMLVSRRPESDARVRVYVSKH